VGQVFTDKLSVEPLGNFQSRHQRNYQDQDSGMKCSSAKLVIVLKRPASATWHGDFNTAITRFVGLEKAVAKKKAQRLWFVDEEQDPPTLQFSFPLWEEKVRCSNYYLFFLLILCIEIQENGR